MIGIVDYGLGNVRAFANIYLKLGVPATVVRNSDELSRAAKIILPGVGAFDHAMQYLDASGMRACLHRRVRDEGVPILGVCVGMQMLAQRSEEGKLAGLGWIEGEVRKFRAMGETPIRIPHMGWNGVVPSGPADLMKGIDPESRFYFLHSYYFEPRLQERTLATTDYHGRFTSVVGAGNVFGVQFHPEKSHEMGTRLLANFARL